MAEGFLAAAIEPARWLDALGQLALATRSDHAQIIGIGADYSLGFNWVSDMDEDVHAAFDRSELVSPLTNYRVAAGVAAPADAIVHEAHYAGFKPGLIGDEYLDLCSDLRIPHGCQTNLHNDAEGLLGFALLRSERSGPTTPEARALFALARADAAAAAALQSALEHEGHRLIAGTFDAMGVACFVLDRRMMVRALSAPAEALLRGDVVRLIDGRVALPGGADDRRLAAALTALGEGRALAGHVAAPDGAGIMVLKAHRLPARDWAMGFAPFAVLIAERPAAALADMGLLRDSYRLTVTESEIALLLRAGQSRAAICTARDITRETLRSHLRALFAKLGVNRETEAIHLLHALLV